MKILFVLEHFYPYIGGAEKLFYELSTILADKGYEIIVVTTQFDKKLPLEEMHRGIKIVRVNCFNRFGFTFFSLPKIFKNAKKCDLIHTTTYNAAMPAVLAGKLLRKPVFVTFHEVWGQLWKSLPFTSPIEKYAFYYFEKLLLSLPFSKFIAVSEFTKTKLLDHGIRENKVELIYNGIDYDFFKNKPLKTSEPFTYTFFGRLGISKGLDLLIPAAAAFRDSYPNSKLKLIIPKQPKKIYAKVMKLISSFELDPHVEFHHNLSYKQLGEELLNSDCVVIPSYSEGFCFAAAETIAFGIPIISSNQGALKEVVSGKFIKMKEMSSNALSLALEKAIQNNWSEEPIKYFHLKDSINKYEATYLAME